MNYQENESGLIELLGELKHVKGTFPPVYRSGPLWIGYDKQGKLKILAASFPEPLRVKWLDQALKTVSRTLAIF